MCNHLQGCRYTSSQVLALPHLRGELAATVATAFAVLDTTPTLCPTMSSTHLSDLTDSLPVCFVQVLASGLGNATLVRAACSLLRQLANSDAIKADIVSAGGLELLCKAVDAHTTHAGKAPLSV